MRLSKSFDGDTPVIGDLGSDMGGQNKSCWLLWSRKVIFYHGTSPVNGATARDVFRVLSKHTSYTTHICVKKSTLVLYTYILNFAIKKKIAKSVTFIESIHLENQRL
jgi:hypothetical protein